MLAAEEDSVRQPYPILEYDPAPHGIIEIDLVEDAMEGMPEHCVICSFRKVIHQHLEQGLLTPFHTVGTEFVGYPVVGGTTGPCASC